MKLLSLISIRKNYKQEIDKAKLSAFSKSELSSGIMEANSCISSNHFMRRTAQTIKGMDDFQG